MVSAPPLRLVFAHYFGGSAGSWAPLTGALGGELDCVAPNLIGFGGAPLQTDRLDLDAYAAQLLTLAGDEPFVLVGHSMGGKLALEIAARTPPNLRGLVLIAPSPPTPEPMDEGERSRAIATHGDPEAARAHIDKIAKPWLPADLFERCVRDEIRADRRAWIWWLETGSREDISARTDGLAAPTLIVTGADDTVMGLSTPFDVARCLKHAEVAVIADGGHLICLEQPSAVAERMQIFLADL